MSALRTRKLGADEAGSFAWAEQILEDTGRLAPGQLALVLQRNPDTPLTRSLKHYLIRLKRRHRGSGVRPKNAAAWEFILFDAKALSEAQLDEAHLEQGDGIRPVRDVQTLETAPDRVSKAVIQEMKILNVDWVTLRNLLSLRAREPELFYDLDPGPLSMPQAAA
jgi:hypothetical protein